MTWSLTQFDGFFNYLSKGREFVYYDKNQESYDPFFFYRDYASDNFKDILVFILFYFIMFEWSSSEHC